MASKRTLESFSSLSSASSPRRPWKYDVFLSFSGEDTRKNFTDHLYHALIDAGIKTYRDDDELPLGNDISTELLNAIRESKISLIVFSRNYAASRWCLDELVKIMECQSTIRQLVLPIFYSVNPSDVRKQTGTFGEAFAELEERFKADMDKVSRWKEALTKAGNLSGRDLTNPANWYEADAIKNIVKYILKHVTNTYLNVAKHPVGISSRVEHMNYLLHAGSNDVRIIGICAMGGMGKTTIAKAVYNQLLSSFQDKCFLDVGITSEKPKDKVCLQKKLLYEILKTKIDVSNDASGISEIENRLWGRRVLVVLDNIDKKWQLDAILERCDWLGLGSKIIITTRDKHLLKEIEVNGIYMLPEFDYYESLELFSCHAFKKSHPEEDYIELSNEVISYCKGLPLALEVLGSFLFGRSELDWKSQLQKLKEIPPGDIQEKLRISYDALEYKERNIFLDIACFFIGVDKDYVVRILDGCGFFAEIGISVLEERCLLNINEENELTMHDLLRDMGREIVCEESPKEPGKQSRLWCYDHALDVLTEHTGTKAVEGLVAELPKSNVVRLSTKAFAKMHILRLLQLNNVLHIEGNDHIFKGLKYLRWHAFPLKFIPNNFHVEKLVVIDMQHSSLKQVWKETKGIEKLKFLDLSHSHYLTETPDFSQLPNLEKLVLEDCTSLVKVHPSIGHLHSLVLVNMRGCKNLKNLPRNICKLKSLKILNLSGCSKIETLPEDLGEMEALLELLVDGTVIRQVPSSILRLKQLTDLSLSGCKRSSSSLASLFMSWVSSRERLNSIRLLPASLLGLSSLTRLSLGDCNLSDEDIPKDLGSLSSLVDLDLRSNNFCSLPASISNLSTLMFLRLHDCTRLQSLPELRTNLWNLEAPGCISLERLSIRSPISFLDLTNCYKLVEILVSDKVRCLAHTCLAGCNNLSDAFKESLPRRHIAPQDPIHEKLIFPGNEIPQFFSHQWTGLSSSFRQPASRERMLKGIYVCAISRSSIVFRFSVFTGFGLDKNGNKISITISPEGDTYHAPVSAQDHIWVSYLECDDDDLSLFYDGDRVEVEIIIHGGELNVNKFGARLMYDDDDDDDDDDDETSTKSDSGESILFNSAVYQVGSKGIKIVHDDDDGEAGPSHRFFDEDLDNDDEAGSSHPERPRYQAGSSKNATNIDDPENEIFGKLIVKLWCRPIGY